MEISNTTNLGVRLSFWELVVTIYQHATDNNLIHEDLGEPGRAWVLIESRLAYKTKQS